MCRSVRLRTLNVEEHAMRLAELEQRMRINEEASDSIKFAALKMTATQPGEAERKAKALRLPERVVMLL